MHLGYSEDPPGERPALGQLEVYGVDRGEVGELRQDLSGAGAREGLEKPQVGGVERETRGSGRGVRVRELVG